MKTFLSLSAAVAFAALVVLPFAAEIAISISFLAALALIFTADYGRRFDPLSQSCLGRHEGRSTVRNGQPNAGVSTRERLRLAA
jgi:hypothetical protein